MKFFSSYRWLLLIILAITVIFIVIYNGITPTLEWKDGALEILGGLVARLVIVGALIDQFISVFFPENDDAKTQRQAAQTALNLNRDKRKTIRKEIFQQSFYHTAAQQIDLDSLNLELNNSANSIMATNEVLNELDTKRSYFIQMVAFAIGLVLAATGITVLTDFIEMPAKASMGVNHYLLYYMDLIFTAALLSGGTSGINQFFKVIRDSWKRNEL